MTHDRLAACARRALLAAAVSVALLGGAAVGPAWAQEGPGVRAGLSASPDQFYFGGHYVTHPLTGMLRFQPNVEAGVGNDRTTIAFNGEFALWRKVSTDWHVYLGAGPAMNVNRNAVRDRTDVEPGFNVVAGLRRRGGLFFEMKVGTIDSPAFKIGVGYTIR